MPAANLSPVLSAESHQRSFAALTPLRVVAMLVLYTVAAMVEAFHLSALTSLANSDVWWHLQTGLWILHHHALPHSRLFSQSSALPWSDSTWGYDILVALAYRLLGLRAIPVLLMLCRVALAVLTFLLARGARGSFISAILLSAVAQYVLADRQALPLYFSILAFGVELLILMETHRSGAARNLFWLPPLFLMWANVHSGFIYGLFLLGLLLAATIVGRWAQNSGIAALNGRIALPVFTVAAVTCASMLATLITPYGYRPYLVAFASFGGMADKYFVDLHSIGFRRPQDYVLLLLTTAAFFALGRRRSLDIFKLALLVGAATLSFHRQRDCWLVVLTSIAIIAEAISGEQPTMRHQQSYDYAWKRTGLVTAGLILATVTITASVAIPRNYGALLKVIGRTYPVAAANYIRDKHLPQPIFNNYEWGGFLAWYLPEYPASNDGRTDLFGDDAYLRYFKVMNAELPPTDEPTLANARALLLPRHSLMGEAFRTLPQFRLAYEDDVAVVLLKPE